MAMRNFFLIIARWIAVFIRTLVSGDKTRFRDSEFDLDLTYITPNLIAMAFPASGIQTLWRNPSSEVAAFLKKYHRDSFLIVNLSEIPYDATVFEGRVVEFGFPDHHNPPIEFLARICRYMHDFLKESPSNVVLVHCLAGRGRTGTVIASYLTFSGAFDNGSEALELFAQRRSHVGKGVRQPSQRRYVQYYSELLAGREPDPSRLRLDVIRLYSIPRFDSSTSGCTPQIEVLTAPTQERPSLLLCRTQPKESYMPWDGIAEIQIGAVLPPNSDIYIRGYHVKGRRGKKEKLENETGYVDGEEHSAMVSADPNEDHNWKRKYMFRFCFHTGFVPRGLLRLTKSELDDAIKSNRFDRDFFLDLDFSMA
eukprot:TRINITY_DN1339_c0_g1_i1.p1 TRINITY_DN1339_c0_g1~~TRINITY_DN1339_c0_g1_i1.p1  ORF type:complete len:366 (-),score=56.10 TRINITY_DN1339_c0_g1_i1:699-1796(-)